MDDRRSDWQQQYEDARPSGALLWCATYRWLVRAIFGTMIAVAAGLLVRAVLEGGRLVSPVLDVVVFVSQFVLWGFWFPRQVDEWRKRQTADVGRQAL